ncbi:MAG: DUF1109 family protein [Deltaproteobacteria bacterium]|nr:DUF1109 family protein [Deltaproteobacteria bacterium]
MNESSAQTEGGGGEGSRHSERLIRAMAQDCAPVRRVPRLFFLAGGLAVVWLAILVIAVTSMGGREGLWAALSGDLLFGGVCAGLALGAMGGAAAGLAGSLPDQEALLRGGGWLAVVGIAWAVGVAGAHVIAPGASQAGMSTSGTCIARAALFGALPAFALTSLALRGWVARPLVAAAVVLLGGAALGSLVVTIACPFEGAVHMLVGHALTPMLLAGLGVLPLTWLLRRFAR